MSTETKKGLIRVGKYQPDTKTNPSFEGFVVFLIHTKGELSPFQMKVPLVEDGKKEMAIFENYYQFSKIWMYVPTQNQIYNRYAGIKGWTHPHEIHLKGDKITDQYWKWRSKGMSFNVPVRYPAGFENRSGTKFSLVEIPKPTETKVVEANIAQFKSKFYKKLSYIEARKQIYLSKYAEIASETETIKKMKELRDNGVNILINEVDGPSYSEGYPYNTVEKCSLHMNAGILKFLVNDSTHPFGHGYCIAAILLDCVEQLVKSKYNKDLVIESADKYT